MIIKQITSKLKKFFTPKQLNNTNRAMMMLYGKLISLIIVMMLIQSVEGVEISLYKALDYYKNRIKDLLSYIIKGRKNGIEEFMLKIKNPKVKIDLQALKRASYKGFSSA